MKNELDGLLDAVFGKKQSAIDRYEVDHTPTLTFGDTTVRAGKPAAGQTGTPKSAAKPAGAHNAAPRRTAPSAKPTAQQPAPSPAFGSAALDEAIARQRADIEALNETALADIRRIGRELETPAVQNLAQQPQAAAVLPGAAGAGVEGFEGLAAALSETVFGQEEYLRRLAIALKRPCVMGHSGSAARNSFFVTGPACTGKRLSLVQAAAVLKSKGVLASDAIAWVDLALYPTPAEEKLFLQDLYMALAGDAELVAFTHYDRCHSGFLTVLANLVQRGESPLASRYVLQNGRLIEAGTALVTDAVRALTPRGKYLVFISTQSVEKLADCFGAPFVSALGDICATAPLSDVALRAISQAQCTLLTHRAQETLQCEVCTEDAVHTLAVNAASGGGAQGVLDFWHDFYRALAQYQLEQDTPAKQAVLCVENGAPAVRLGETTHALATLVPQHYTGEAEAVKAEMAQIVGLADVKEYVLRLEDNFAMQKRRKAAGLKTAAVSMHMIFTGNPGTGKTTIARLVSKYLKAIGVLSGGQLVEVTRADLVGKYVGHTAPLTTQVLQSALGGVLFIDEAYSLYRGRDDAFGLEAIDTLVKGMEDHRDNLIVILAGYSKEMAEFLTANSGLKSRFPNIIEFPDYTGAELLAITKLQAVGKGYALDARCDEVLLPYYNAVQLTRARDAGNGRLARNKLEEAILRQAKRCTADLGADLALLVPEDFLLDDIAP